MNAHWRLLRPVVLFGLLASAVLGEWEAKAGGAVILEVVKYGNARARIVVADKPEGTTLDAAAALQRHIFSMTGSLIAIKSESKYDGEAAPMRSMICLSGSAAAGTGLTLSGRSCPRPTI